ncbi:TlpA family protein disulfide reductase [Pseudobacteriovorax antillogorgiicola]|uniref:AhpC/TSA family protein n=1 Tax=Pseudobacteriovorax antillogorgiicola TaxID=1513793 RepID=A0A1Y6C0U5_9BACT|nr:redoxin domain-containing protein [Pseudobacteriovorax antillogorgiicola]TCS52343.1 AhpC/TSA family protein [Pseudobacteriovorax antillogorgiicola]SMF29695.1 AhpC/TSA family protein [Pseudobacteriovorax antillogorgiicola]
MIKKFFPWIAVIPFLIGAGETRSDKMRRLATTNNITTEYVHSWKKFPTIAGQAVGRDAFISVKPTRGKAVVAVFIASWCLPCQVLIQDIKAMEKKFEMRHTRFVYVFAHDTKADAEGFRRTYKIGSNGLLANVELMKTFHQPELPSIYVSDRKTWLVWRAVGVKREQLAELDEFLDYHTAN